MQAGTHITPRKQQVAQLLCCMFRKNHHNYLIILTYFKQNIVNKNKKQSDNIT